MVDLAPEGCLSLRDFYDQLTSRTWNGCNPFAELDLEERMSALPGERRPLHRAGLASVIETGLADAVSAFVSDSLRAFVVLSERDRRELSPRAWREAFFPERMFLSDTVGQGHGGEFDAAVGRTPFIRDDDAKRHFRDLSLRRQSARAPVMLRECLIGLVMDGIAGVSEADDFARRWGLAPMETHPQGEKYDPKKQVVWTLPMTLSWMIWRNYHRVREAMDSYRTDCWVWTPINRRLPLNGGADWYEIRGSELQSLTPLSIFKIGLMEALSDPDYENVSLSAKAAREELWANLTQGALTAVGIDREGKVGKIPEHEWPYLSLEADSGGRDRLVFPNGGPMEAYRQVTLTQSDVTSIWHGYPEPPQPPMMALLMDDVSWTFYDAATWVGCRGRELPSAQVASENRVGRGAYALFRALFPKRDLVASGLNRRRLREPIPAEYWEMATTDPGQFRERHYVSFIDEILKGYGGQITPVGEDAPRWFGIQLERDAVLAAFPDILLELRSGGQVATAPSFVAPPIRTPDKLQATCQALNELFPNGPPKGLAVKDRLKAINDWHERNGSSKVGQTTVRRALRRVHPGAK